MLVQSLQTASPIGIWNDALCTVEISLNALNNVLFITVYLINKKKILHKYGVLSIIDIKLSFWKEVTVTFAHHSLIQGNRAGVLYGLIATILLALVFTLFQGVEYSVSSFTISDGAFGSCFYFGTGLTIAPIKFINLYWVTGFALNKQNLHLL